MTSASSGRRWRDVTGGHRSTVTPEGKRGDRQPYRPVTFGRTVSGRNNGYRPLLRLVVEPSVPPDLSPFSKDLICRIASKTSDRQMIIAGSASSCFTRCPTPPKFVQQVRNSPKGMNWPGVRSLVLPGCHATSSPSILRKRARVLALGSSAICTPMNLIRRLSDCCRFVAGAYEGSPFEAPVRGFPLGLL